MYYAIIKSTFKEYPLEGKYFAENIESAKKYLMEVLDILISDSKNEKQKKFAEYLINRLKNSGVVSFGYGTNKEYIAIEIIEKESYDKKIMETKKKLLADINKMQEELLHLRAKQ